MIETKVKSEMKDGYKESKIGLIPIDWQIFQFNEVFKLLKSYSFSRNDLTDYDNKGDTYYIHYGDIHSKFEKLILNLDKENTANIPLLRDTSKPDKDLVYLKEGDLIIADASEDYEGVAECIEIGKIQNGKKIIGGLHTIIARDKKGNTAKKFRSHLLKSWPVAKELKKIATGISVLGISKNNIEKVKIPLPPLSQQEKIAEILTTWDEAISKTEKLIDAKKRYKKGLMQRLLSGKVRFPEFEGEDWVEVKLGDITEVISSNLDKKIKEGQENVRLCNYMDVYGNAIIDSSLPFMESTASEREIEKYTLKQDDVIITKDSETADDIANAAVVKNLESRVLCGYHLAILRPNKEKVLGDFLAKQIMTFVYRKQFFQMANGATRYGLRISDIENAKFNIPSLEEQKKISTLINSINNEINLINKQKLAFENQKKRLMQQLLTGKVRVN